MRAISIIKSEHQNLGAVLYSLEKLIDTLSYAPDSTPQTQFEAR